MTDKELQDAIKGRLSVVVLARVLRQVIYHYWPKNGATQKVWIEHAKEVINAIESGRCWKDVPVTQDAPERVLDNRKEVR